MLYRRGDVRASIPSFIVTFFFFSFTPLWSSVLYFCLFKAEPCSRALEPHLLFLCMHARVCACVEVHSHHMSLPSMYIQLKGRRTHAASHGHGQRLRSSDHRLSTVLLDTYVVTPQIINHLCIMASRARST